jgi:pimeloyl-ACP methyl ester carboxylesterase
MAMRMVRRRIVGPVAGEARPADKVRIDAYGPPGRSAWRDVDWRAHQRWVEVDGSPVNLIDLGSGDRTFVFVHGLSGSWQNWLEQLPVFAEHGRALAMDLPGFGASPMPRGPITIAGYGRTIDAVLERASVTGPVVLVGNSMGGFIGAEMGLSFPQRLEQLVLVSAAGLTIEHQRNDLALRGLYRLDELLALYGAAVAQRSGWLVRRPRGRAALLNVVATHPARLDPAFVAEQLKGSGKPGFVPALDALTDYPIRERLGEIACPTLIVWGDRDQLVPARDAYEFERLIPDSRVVMYEDTGHCAMFERPAHFNELVLDFARGRVATT